jgi:hypothetical protein
MRPRTWLSLGLALAMTVPAASQMEKRSDELYGKDFSAAAPAVGTQVPDLVLGDIEGRPWALSSLKGSTVVIIKGGFT